MNRRELLKSLPIVAAITPGIVSSKGSDTTLHGYQIEEGPFYLFVLNGCMADVGNFVDSFRESGSKVRGAIAICPDGDMDNFIRIYKLDEK